MRRAEATHAVGSEPVEVVLARNSDESIRTRRIKRRKRRAGWTAATVFAASLALGGYAKVNECVDTGKVGTVSSGYLLDDMAHDLARGRFEEQGANRVKFCTIKRTRIDAGKQKSGQSIPLSAPRWVIWKHNNLTR